MRISLWQQFSSNHSASYTVVGEFQSAESAQEASVKIRRIVEEAIQWCFQNREECYNLVEPTPVEASYALQYGFDWKQRIDWLSYGVKEAITAFDRLVIIDPNHVDTWQTGHQFTKLLSAMGAKVARSVMEGIDPDGQRDVWTDMGLEVHCLTQTPNDAASLVKTLTSVNENQEKRPRNSYHIPWLHFHPMLSHMSKDEVLALETHYLDDQNLIDGLRVAHSKLNEIELHELWGKTRSLTHDKWKWVGDRRREIDAYSITVTHIENELIIQDISFARIPIGLPAFIQYLESVNCSNIRYHVFQYGDANE